MKKLLLIYVFFFVAVFGYAQNLVPNPSFESYTVCPSTNNNITDCSNWKNFGNSPDYYNACAPSGLSVPDNSAGYQYANNGVAMAGIVTYVWQSSPGWPYYREFIGAQLTNQLLVGQKYFVSFFINFAGYLQGWQKIGADKIGIKFSTVEYNEMNPPSLNNTANFYTDSIYTDTTQWVKLSGSFIADSSYNYIILGNFFDETQTDTMIFGGPPFGGSSAYYFIDDICVSTDSNYNQNWTGILFREFPDCLMIYPIPATDKLYLETNSSITEISIYNHLGSLVSKFEFYDESFIRVLNMEKYENGVYYIYVVTNEGVRKKKILLNIK